MSVIHSSRMFTNASHLISLSNKTASPEQEKDLLSFFEIGTMEFQEYVKSHILKEASVCVPQRKKKLPHSQKKR